MSHVIWGHLPKGLQVLKLHDSISFFSYCQLFPCHSASHHTFMHTYKLKYEDVILSFGWSLYLSEIKVKSTLNERLGGKLPSTDAGTSCFDSQRSFWMDMVARITIFWWKKKSITVSWTLLSKHKIATCFKLPPSLRYQMLGYYFSLRYSPQTTSSKHTQLKKKLGLNKNMHKSPLFTLTCLCFMYVTPRA